MRGDSLLIITAIVVILSVLSTLFAYFSILGFVSKISGFALGEVNFTVESAAQINFTVNSIDWGSGRVDSGETAAYLDTQSGTVVNGNWSAVSTSLIVENTGNSNLTLNISGSGLNASEFIGGTNPAYLWNVTNHEASSCLNSTGCSTCYDGLSLGFFANVNTTPDALFCDIFRFESGQDTVKIEFNLTVPDDSLTGTLSETITATAIVL